MRNHRLATLVAAAAMATASGLVVASPAHAATATFVLQNENSGGCLQPAGGSAALGAAITQEACNGSLAQQWTPTPASSGVHLVNMSSGLCLDARGGAVNGTPVQQWTCDSISNENWSSGPPVTTRQSFLGDPGPLVTGEELISGVSGTSSHCVSAGLFYGVPLSLMSCTSQSWELFN
jgi:Ricin-type beta-trefoil lectin domain-like